MERELTDEDFDKLRDSEYDLEEENEEKKDKLITAYKNIIDLLQKYCDLNPDYYPLIAIWIIGSYAHHDFESYPYLFLNAMRGSGKSRTLRLVTDLSKEGDVQTSMTEAVLFRTNGTLGIDEFESVGRKGKENLRELLNASYKKGTKVKRIKERRTPEGIVREVESFDVYRPIIMANIWGMEEVLGDRCITLILERSNNPKIIRLAEIWKSEKIFQKTKEILESVVMCSSVVVGKCYQEWNNFVTSNNTTNITTTNTTTTHNYTKLFKMVNLMELDGRSLELCLPLLVISWEISEVVFRQLHTILQNMLKEKKDEQFAESRDISFIDYVSQETEVNWIFVKDVTRRFKEFLQYESEDDNWLNIKWVGQALNRLKLRRSHKRDRGGMKVVLDIDKAQQKIKMFK